MLSLNVLSSNMTELDANGIKVLFSYNTPVAAYSIAAGQYYKTNKKWSVTTSKHINKWLDGKNAMLQDQPFFDNLVKHFNMKGI
jgi:hypothetical protein